MLCRTLFMLGLVGFILSADGSLARSAQDAASPAPSKAIEAIPQPSLTVPTFRQTSPEEEEEDLPGVAGPRKKMKKVGRPGLVTQGVHTRSVSPANGAAGMTTQPTRLRSSVPAGSAAGIPAVQGLTGTRPQMGRPGTASPPSGSSSGLPNAGGAYGSPSGPGGMNDTLGAPPAPLPEPTGNAKLWVDREIGTVDLVRDQSASLRWDVRDVNNANGIGVLVRESPPSANVCRNLNFDSLQGLAGTGVYPGETGSARFLPEIPDENLQLHIVACVYDRTGGRNVSLDRETNRILAVTGERPDLAIVGIHLVDRRISFDILNFGKGTKIPGELHYRLHRTAEPEASRPYAMKHFGLARKASRTALLPGKILENEVVEGVRFEMSGPGSVRICLNDTREVKERDYSNNCKEIQTGVLYPDLAILNAQFQLHPAVDTDDPSTLSRVLGGITRAGGAVAGALGKVGLFLSDPFPSFEGAPPKNFRLEPNDEGITFIVQNMSQETSPPSQVHVRFTAAGKDVGGMTVDVPELADRHALPVKIVLNSRDKRSSPTLRNNYGDACCDVSLFVDAKRQITESNEANNEVRVVGTGGQRDPVRDNRR